MQDLYFSTLQTATTIGVTRYLQRIKVAGLRLDLAVARRGGREQQNIHKITRKVKIGRWFSV